MCVCVCVFSFISFQSHDDLHGTGIELRNGCIFYRVIRENFKYAKEREPSCSHYCRKPARDIPLVTKVMRKEARHTQRRHRASGVPPDILEHLPPKTRVCLLYCFVLSPLTLLGAVPHHHLALSVKELTYSSN